MATDIIARGMASNAAKDARAALDELAQVIEGTMNSQETVFTDSEGNIVTPDQDTVYLDTNNYVYYRWNGSNYYVVSDPRAVVRYTPQDLADEEKAQARENIDANAITFVSDVTEQTETNRIFRESGDSNPSVIFSEEHEGGEVTYEKTSESNNQQVTVANFFNNYDSELSHLVTINSLTNVYTTYYAGLPYSALRLGTSKNMGSITFTLSEECVICAYRYFSYNSQTGEIISYDVSSINVDGHEYGFEGDEDPFDITLDAGQHTVTSVNGRIFLFSFAFETGPYTTYEAKEIAREEDLTSTINDLATYKTTTNERLSIDENAIQKNANDLILTNEKIGPVQIYNWSGKRLPNASENYVNKIIRWNKKLYQCVTEGDGYHKDFVFDVSGTSEITVGNWDSFARDVGNDFGSNIESDDFAKLFRNNGNIRLGSSSATGYIYLYNISGKTAHNVKIGLKAYNDRNSSVYIVLASETEEEEHTLYLTDNVNERVISLENDWFDDVDSAYISINSISEYTDPDTGEVYQTDKRAIITRISADFGEVSYEWKEFYPPMIEITYTELKKLRNNNQLIPGQQYRIIDYVTTTNGGGCTDLSITTSSAEHQFDIIITADTTNTLNENARACVHFGDTYFGEEKQSIISANWENPDIQPEDVEILGLLSDGDEIKYKESHESAKIITALTMLPNANGITVPAMFNPDPNESGNDCYYIYDGTFSLTKWVNDLVSVQGTINDEEEVLYEAGKYHPEDIFVELGYEEIDGVMTPVLYKNDLDEPDYIEEGPDYADRFVYIGNFELDGITYNRWNKQTSGVDTGYQVLTQIIVIDNQFTITQEQLTNAIHQTPIVYDKWQEFNVNGSSQPGFQSYWHLTEHLVDANVSTTWIEKYKLSAWKIQYCIDNDTSKFAWADSINGKGVIYHMIDEWNNDLPYDFKNILYHIDNNARYTFNNEYDGDVSLKGACNNNKIGRAHNNLNCILFGDNCYSNTFGNNCNSNTFGDNCYSNTFGNNCNSNTFGDNCNSNTFGDNCNSNTFGDICSFNTFGDNCDSNTFDNNCSSNIFDYNCDSNTFDNDCYSNRFGNSCISNTFGEDCQSNTFSNYCQSNTFSNNCDSNTFGNSCHDNIFGNYCDSNTFGSNCISNTFGDDCDSNTFDNSCRSNTFGDSCKSNTFGNNYRSNTFNNSCYSNKFGDNCSSNTFGDSCSFNTFGDDCDLNIFDYNCNSNTFDNGCYSNRFGNSCVSNTFGNGCASNTFGNGCDSNTFSNYCQSNTFGDSCDSNTFSNGCSSNTFYNLYNNNTLGTNCSYIILTSQDPSNYFLQYIHIHSGIHGTDDSNKLTITESRGLDHTVDYYATGSEEKYI